MLKVIFHEAAELEAAEAVAWYEENEEGLGVGLREEIELSVNRIVTSPVSFPVVYSSTVRRVLTRRFPYSLIYSIEHDTILIISVFHSSRDPMVWKGRID